MGCALKMGAWIGGAQDHQAQLIFDFGELLGTAFQIQDDYLDAFGDPASFGKQVGGDIIENKKTILYHKTLALGTTDQKIQLLEWFEASKSFADGTKISEVKKLFKASGAAQASQKLMQQYTKDAFDVLDSLDLIPEKKQLLVDFANQLMQRKY